MASAIEVAMRAKHAGRGMDVVSTEHDMPVTSMADESP